MASQSETDKLLGFVLISVQRFKSFDSVDVPTANYKEFELLFGLWAQVERFARSYIRLRGAGLTREGRVVVRAALEHAITLQWVYLTESGLDRFKKGQISSHSGFYSDFARLTSNEELKALVAQRPEANDQEWPRFRDIRKEFDSDDFLFLLYRVLSQITHVSYAATIDMLAVVDEDTYINHGREDDGFEHISVYALASSCLLADWVLARLVDDSSRLKELDYLSDELQIPVRLDHQLQPERKRFPNET